MKRGVAYLLVSVFFLFVIAHGVLAETNIKITSKANDSINLNVLNPETMDAYMSYLNDTDSSGSFTFVYTGQQPQISITIIARRNGGIIYNRYYGNYSTGGNINIDLNIDPNAAPPVPTPVPAPAPVVNTTNTTDSSDTPAVTTNTTTTQNASSLLAGISSSLGKVSWSIVAYVVGAIILILAIIFGIRYYLAHKSQFPTHKMIASKPVVPVRGSGAFDKDLMETERKLRAASAELEAIKNKQVRVREAERKFEEARRELERAKKGY